MPEVEDQPKNPPVTVLIRKWKVKNRSWLWGKRPANGDEIRAMEADGLDMSYAAEEARKNRVWVENETLRLECERARKRQNQRDYRERKKAQASQKLAEVDDVLGALNVAGKPYGVEAIRADATALAAWLALDGPKQRQLRGRARAIMARRIFICRWRAAHGGDDPPAMKLAEAIKVDRHAARKALELHQRLETTGVWREGGASGVTAPDKE